MTKLNGTALATPLVTTYTYDAVGNKHTETLPDGTVTTYLYDDLNHLQSLSTVQGSVMLHTQVYTFNSDGTRATSMESIREPDGSTETLSTTWTYDADARLTNEAVSSSVAAHNFSDHFAFDLSNNRITDTHTGPGGGASDTITYKYNADDSLASQKSAVTHIRTLFGYDANRGEYSTYAYDQLDASTGEPYSGMMYDRVTDANGYKTDTYHSGDGLTSITVYDDGSYTESIRSAGDTPVAGYEISAGTLPTLAAGGSETVQIAQHKDSDTNVPVTIDLYDRAGNLMDVYLPAVADALNGRRQFAYDLYGNQTAPKGGVGRASRLVPA